MPFKNAFKSPFNLANKIENDVNAISFGTISSTVLNACESVITSFGLTFKDSIASYNSDSLTTMLIQLSSKHSLKV